MFFERCVQPDDAIARVYEDGALALNCRNCGSLLLVPAGMEPECLEPCVPEMHCNEDAG